MAGVLLAGVPFVVAVPMYWAAQRREAKEIDEITADQLKGFAESLEVGGTAVDDRLITPSVLESASSVLALSDQAEQVSGDRLAALFNTPISKAFTPKKVLVLDMDMRLSLALKILSNARVLSAPVVEHPKVKWYEEIPDTPINCTCKGYFSVMDMVNLVIEKLRADPNVNIGHLFSKTKLKDIAVDGLMPSPQRWVPLMETESVFKLLQIFSGGIHRVPIYSNELGDMRLVSLVTQSTCLQMLARKRGSLGEMAEKSLKELGAYRNQCISAVAVVDEEDKLIGQLTIHHLKGLTASNWKLLTESVSAFVEACSIEKKMSAVVCPSSTSLKEAITLLENSRAHRLWVISEKGKLKGLLALTDLLKTISNHDADIKSPDDHSE